MDLRLRLFFLVALTILLVAENTAARKETKPQDGPEGTDVAAGGTEESKTQDHNTQPDAAKVLVKQKWQRYKAPSSKKMKKADSWKEKAGRKSGKEKWKAGPEETSKQKKKKPSDYGKQLHYSNKGKWVKKDKTLKHNTKRDKRSQTNEDLNVEENGLIKNKQKVGFNNNVKGKVVRKDNSKSDISGSVCLKDEQCSNDVKMRKDNGKNVWKRKNNDEPSSVPKSVQFSKVKVSNSDSNVGDMNNGEEVQQHQKGVVNVVKNEQGGKQDETNSASQKTVASEIKEETKAKTNESSKKKKSGVSVPEQEEGLFMPTETETKFSKSKGLKIRRYIVEEEVVEDSQMGEAATSDSEIPQLMQ